MIRRYLWDYKVLDPKGEFEFLWRIDPTWMTEKEAEIKFIKPLEYRQSYCNGELQWQDFDE